jgi:putative ABC transport system permease protein
MFTNYLKTALRFLKRNKIFAGINMLGLSIALAVSFIILLFIINEVSYDYCHKNRKHVFRVLNHYSEFNTTQPGTPYILASTLKAEFLQVEKAANAQYVRSLKLKLGEEFITVAGAVATSSEIFDIFTIPLIGSLDAKKLLDDRNSIVLSREIAEKFFPGEEPTGKGILGLVNNEEQMFTVTGVFEDIPVNSTFRAKCFVNGFWTIEPINTTFNTTDAETNWHRDFWTTWILLSDKARLEEVENQFSSIETKYMNNGMKRSFSIQNLSDVYLKSDKLINTGLKGDIKNIRLFSAIAFLIVMVAAMNYIILSTAVSTQRSKEIGIRKTNGANNFSIRKQLIGESMLLALLVLPVAVVLMRVALPYAGKLFQTKLQVINSNIVVYILIYLILAGLIGIVSGLYTSVYLSRLKVIDVLKKAGNTGKQKQVFRSVLVLTQLVIFCSFVSSTLIIRSQYQYALQKDTGYYINDILLIDLGRNFKSYQVFLNSIKSNPNVTMAAGTMEALPMQGSMASMYPNSNDPSQKVKVEGMAVDYNFLKTMGVEVLNGREFSEEFPGDLQKSVMLNEKAVKELGIVDPIGKLVGGQTVIGIVKDFNLHSIRTDIPPTAINMTDEYIHQIAVRYRPGSLDELLPAIKSDWEKIAPDQAFRYSTIEDLLKNIYASEKNLSTIVSIFALFTLIISAFGLFGFTLFVAKSRTKEIGIRKVFGSSEKSIVYSFLKTNLILVSLAALISIPFTLYFMGSWLKGYASKVTINGWFFLISFVVAAVVVLLTVVFHSFKASQINPVKALRYE